MRGRDRKATLYYNGYQDIARFNYEQGGIHGDTKMKMEMKIKRRSCK